MSKLGACTRSTVRAATRAGLGSGPSALDIRWVLPTFASVAPFLCRPPYPHLESLDRLIHAVRLYSSLAGLGPITTLLCLFCIDLFYGNSKVLTLKDLGEHSL